VSITIPIAIDTIADLLACPRSRWQRFVGPATAVLVCLGCARSPSVQTSAIPPTEAAASSRASVAATDSTRPLLVLGLDAASPEEPRTHALRVTSKVDTLFSLEAADAGWAPGGERIAYTRSTDRGRPQLRVRHLDRMWRMEREDTIAIGSSEEGVIPWPIWSPGGNAIGVLVHDKGGFPSARVEFVVVDPARRAVARRYQLPEGVVNVPMYLSGVDKLRWAPDGTAVLISWGAGAILELESGRLDWISRAPIIGDWAPDGRGVYFFEVRAPDDPRQRGLGEFFYRPRGDGSKRRLADYQTLDKVALKESRFLVFARVLLSPSGRQLAVAAGSAGDSSGIRLYPGASSGDLDITKPERTIWVDAVVTGLEWSPDERQLAAVLVRPAGISIEQFDLGRSTWTRVGTLDLAKLPGPAIDLLGLLRIVSWTQ
jgi:hypothetical protein